MTYKKVNKGKVASERIGRQKAGSDCMNSSYPHRLIDALLSSALVPNRFRVKGMRLVGYSLAGAADLGPGMILGSKRIAFGENVFVNSGLYYDGHDDVHVGRNVAFGPFVRLITVTHEIGPAEKRCVSRPVTMPIRIEDGCWIAGGVTVLPGVTIRTGCVVAAGAVVRSSTQANGLYGGVPARRIRDLDG